MSGQCHGMPKRLYWVRTVLHGQCWYQSFEIVNKYFKVLRVRADVKLTVLKTHITERYRPRVPSCKERDKNTLLKSHRSFLTLSHTQTLTG